MTKQAGANVSPADDPTRTFASGQRCQSRPVGIDAVEMVGASDKFAELQFTRLIERDHAQGCPAADATNRRASRSITRTTLQRANNHSGDVWAPGMLVIFRAEVMPGRERADTTFLVKELLPKGSWSSRSRASVKRDF